MPILFPIAYASKYGEDEYLNIDGDSSVDKIKLRSEIITDSSLDVQTENQKSSPILAMETANELNLEYSNLFESLLYQLEDSEVSKGRGLQYEFESSLSEESTVTSMNDGSGNFAESGLYEFDTVIDEPKSMEFTDYTIYEEEMEVFLTEDEPEINDLQALETMYPGLRELYEKKGYERDYDPEIGGVDFSKMNIRGSKFIANTGKQKPNVEFEDWYERKNKTPPTPSNVKPEGRTIIYVGFKNS